MTESILNLCLWWLYALKDTNQILSLLISCDLAVQRKKVDLGGRISDILLWFRLWFLNSTKARSRLFGPHLLLLG